MTRWICSLGVTALCEGEERAERDVPPPHRLGLRLTSGVRKFRADRAGGEDQVLRRGAGLGPAAGLQAAVGVDPQALGRDGFKSFFSEACWSS